MQIDSRYTASLPFADPSAWLHPRYTNIASAPRLSDLYVVDEDSVAAIEALRESKDSVCISYDKRPGWYGASVNMISLQLLEEQAAGCFVIASDDTLRGAAAAAAGGAAVGVFAEGAFASTLRLAFTRNAFMRIKWQPTLEPDSLLKRLYHFVRRYFRPRQIDAQTIVTQIRGNAESRMVTAKMLRDEGFQRRYPWLNNANLERLASLACTEYLHRLNDAEWRAPALDVRYAEALTSPPKWFDVERWLAPPPAVEDLLGWELYYKADWYD